MGSNDNVKFNNIRKGVLFEKEGRMALQWFKRVDWIYELSEDCSWKQTIITVPQTVHFYDLRNVLRLSINTTGLITVHAGYAWDGCSPKFTVRNSKTIIGTPEGLLYLDKTLGKNHRRKTYYASLVHDALYQFLDEAAASAATTHTNNQPLYTRQQADRCFHALLKETHFLWAGVYFAAVRVFGGRFRRRTKERRKTVGKISYS